MNQHRELVDTIMNAVSDAMANMHTSTIAKITKINPTTINCQPVINRVVNGESIELPEFIEVPPMFLQGGADYLAHPITVDDYCLLIFTERCFDNWYNGQDNQSPLEMRMHDYSDGFAFVGINPLSAAIIIPTETTMTGTMRLGVSSPTDFMALAGLVLSELQSVKSDLDGFKSTFDAHTHSASGAAPPATPFPNPHTPGSVASSYVKAE